MTKKIRAFILGVLEFRHSVTTGFDSWPELYAYDTGRDLAHRLTFRVYDR